MKKWNKVVLLALLFCIIFAGFGFASELTLEEEFDNYFWNIVKTFTATHMKVENGFIYIVFPYSPQLIIAGVYPEYLEKGYTKQQIIQEVEKGLSNYDAEPWLDAYFSIGLLGGTLDETRKKIPEDFVEYVFLVNDKGDSVRGWEYGARGDAGEFIHFYFEFPITYEKGGSILENTEYIEFVVWGLGFKDNRFRYRLPLYKMGEDTPEPLKELFTELNITEYPFLGKEQSDHLKE